MMKINYSNLVWLFVPLLGFYSPSFAQNPQVSEKGFKKIFDGKTLKGWEGDPVYWKVENGSIVGEITPATIVKRNTFIIYRDAKPSDFELKCEVKITKDGNTGINYRLYGFEILHFDSNHEAYSPKILDDGVY